MQWKCGELWTALTSVPFEMASGRVPKIGMMLCMDIPQRDAEVVWPDYPAVVSAQQQQGKNQDGDADSHNDYGCQSGEALAAVAHSSSSGSSAAARLAEAALR